MIHARQLLIPTRGKALYPITREVAAWIASLNIQDALLTLFIQHTSASLTIQENADPDVLRDLATFFEQLAPEDDARYRHNTEGSDDMPGHIRSVLTQSSLSIPIANGRMALGTWQGIYVFEHRTEPQRRSVFAQLLS